MYISKIRAALLCYKYYCVVPALLAIPGCWLYMQDRLVVPLIIIKATTDALIWFFITSMRGDQFYYYYNLHVSRTFLFLTWLLADLSLFCIMLWLTTLTW